MDKLQEKLIDAHRSVQDIGTILDIVAEHINFKACDKKLIEDYAILNANLPLVKAALEDILDVSGIIVTTDITSSGTPFVRYLEDAQFNKAQEKACLEAEQRTKKELDSNIGKSNEDRKDIPNNEE
jgi:hypothetical protein